MYFKTKGEHVLHILLKQGETNTEENSSKMFQD